jgi:hypothetical protein
MIILIIKMIVKSIGTSWQRVVDMNPQVASGCNDVVSAGQVLGIIVKKRTTILITIIIKIMTVAGSGQVPQVPVHVGTCQLPATVIIFIVIVINIVLFFTIMPTT